MSAAKEEWAGGGGRPFQYAATRSQRAALEGRQRAGVSQILGGGL